MQFLPSVSRSSGLEDGGDVLKGHKMQQDYRNFIQEKLEIYWKQFPLSTHLTITGALPGEQRNTQSNILILFRKLREGILASKRVDDFALEVYETSLHLSVLFRAPIQTSSIIAQLLPQRIGASGFYDEFSGDVALRTAHPSSLAAFRIENPSGETIRGTKPEVPTGSSTERQVYSPPHARRGRPLHASRDHVPLTGASRMLKPQAPPKDSLHVMPRTYPSTWLLSLVHALLQAYPSRSIYYAQLNICQQFQNGGGMTQWLNSILAALESRNYTRFERLTRSSEVEALFQSLAGADSITRHMDVGCFALKCLVADLRAKARETAWTVLRTAYRELDVTQSANWMLRILMIYPDVDIPDSAAEVAQNWLGEKPAMEVSKKEGEGSEGRWVLYRRK